jgi:hypothetical protein
MFSLQQNQRTRGWNRVCLKGRGRKVMQIMYAHVSKFKKGKNKNFKSLHLDDNLVISYLHIVDNSLI